MTATLHELKPSQLKDHKSNPRKAIGDVAELAASIKEKGIIEPLVVAPNGTADTYVLLAGHRRLAAAKLAKLTTVPCIVRADITGEQEQLEHMLVENLQRTNLSPIEEGDAYQQLLLFTGYTQKRIAATTGRSLETVRSRLKLTQLPKAARDQVHSGQLALAAADLIVAFADQPAEFKRLTRAIDDGRLAYELKSIKEKQARARKHAKLVQDLADSGVRVLTKELETWIANAPGQRLYGEQDIEAHRECPGFCAFVKPGSEWQTPATVYYCDQWATLHAEVKDAADVANAIADGDFDPEADKQLALALKDAETARREHLVRIFSDPTEDMALAALRAYAHEHLVDEIDGWILTDLLGIDPDADVPPVEAMTDYETTVGPPTLEERIADRINQLTATQLALLLDITNTTHEDYQLTNTWAWRQTVGGCADWRNRIAGPYGYEWSEVEAELLDAADQERKLTAAVNG